MDRAELVSEFKTFITRNEAVLWDDDFMFVFPILLASSRLELQLLWRSDGIGGTPIVFNSLFLWQRLDEYYYIMFELVEDDFIGWEGLDPMKRYHLMESLVERCTITNDLSSLKPTHVVWAALLTAVMNV